MKKCSKCEVEKSIDDFYMDKRRNQPRHHCKECHKRSSVEWKRSSPKALARHNAYMREYNKRPEVRASQKAWRDSPEGRAWIKAYRQREDVMEANRRHSRDWSNTPAGKAAIAAWYEANRETVRGYSRRYRAKLRDALVPGMAEPRLDVLTSFYGSGCMVPGCEDDRLELDHIIPISKSGKHTYWNAQVLCRSHNASKNASDQTDYRDGHSQYGKLIDRVIT